MLPDLSAVQWILGAFAGALIGFSKTGVPGAGILVIPVMAAIFGGRSSVGTLLPMLIFADCFAVLWYRRHTRWDKLIVIIPWVAAGMAIGAWFLQYLGEASGTKDVLSQIIGWLVLVMLAVHLARSVWGDRLVPHSRAAAASTGAAAGFATTVSNAAGPIMTIYFQGWGLNKEQFLARSRGTSSFNMTKVPIFWRSPWLTGGAAVHRAGFPVRPDRAARHCSGGISGQVAGALHPAEGVRHGDPGAGRRGGDEAGGGIAVQRVERWGSNGLMSSGVETSWTYRGHRGPPPKRPS